MPRLHSTINSGFLLLTCMTMALWFVDEVIAGEFYQTQWKKYDLLVQSTSHQYRIDPRLIHAVIWQESNYNRRAISSAGAQGLMQLMPGTAKDLGVRRSFSSRQNIDGGTRYLIKQLQRFGSVKQALQAYHCGPNCVSSGKTPKVSIRYSNQVIARFHHIKRWYPADRQNLTSILTSTRRKFGF